MLVADLSIDDADEMTGPAHAAGLDTVFMVTPNTEPDRMKRIAAKTTGFVYTVSLLGVTGSREALSNAVDGLIRRLKGLTDVPICVGFGVSKPEHARTIARRGRRRRDYRIQARGHDREQPRQDRNRPSGKSPTS